jgi:hypothetical protein
MTGWMAHQLQRLEKLGKVKADTYKRLEIFTCQLYGAPINFISTNNL